MNMRRLRLYLRKIMLSFERALQRVEDQGVRIEQAVDNAADTSRELVKLSQQLNENFTEVRALFHQENSDRKAEISRAVNQIADLRSRLSVAEKKLAGSDQDLTH